MPITIIHKNLSQIQPTNANLYFFRWLFLLDFVTHWLWLYVLYFFLFFEIQVIVFIQKYIKKNHIKNANKTRFCLFFGKLFCCSVTRDDSLLYVNFCLMFFKFEKQTMNKKKRKMFAPLSDKINVFCFVIS